MKLLITGITENDMEKLENASSELVEEIAKESNGLIHFEPAPERLTKREYFAGQAMRAALSKNYTDIDLDVAAKFWVECADKLIEQLENPKAEKPDNH